MQTTQQPEASWLPQIREEYLPFTVSVVSSSEQLQKAVDIRQRAYSRHLPELGAQLWQAEAQDLDDNTTVLLAESRLDGSPLGTLRIQLNNRKPLAIEQSVTLPNWLQGKRLAEATRLGVEASRVGRVVKTALFKAYYGYCLANDVDWLVVAARRPLDRMYEALMFVDVFDNEFLPMHHVGGIPHRVLAFDVASARERWEAAQHPLLDFMCYTRHPGIASWGLQAS